MTNSYPGIQPMHDQNDHCMAKMTNRLMIKITVILHSKLSVISAQNNQNDRYSTNSANIHFILQLKITD